MEKKSKMIDAQQFRDEIIRPVLKLLEGRDSGANWSGQASEELVLGTTLVESQLTFLKQHGNGPALGVGQLEPDTIHDIVENYIRYRTGLQQVLDLIQPVWPITPAAVKGNLYLTVFFIRLHYRRAPQPLPQAGDIEAMGNYWKKFYNTHLGKGTVNKYVEAWNLVHK